MKCLVALTTLFLLAVAAGCGEKPTPSGSSASSETLSGIPVAGSVTTLDKEAAEKAVPAWKPTKIGESYYIEAVLLGNDSATTVYHKGKIFAELFELRNVSAEVRGWSISEADRLNGVEWKGNVSLLVGAVRCYVRERGQFQDKKSKMWSAWGQCTSPDRAQFNCFLEVHATKANGKWEASYYPPAASRII